MLNYAKDLENSIKLQGCPSDIQDKVKEVVTEYFDVVVRMDSEFPYIDFIPD